MNQLKHILFIEPTRWAELLLAMIKIALGISLLWYLWEPPRTSAALTQSQAALIGAAIMLVGIAQLLAVWLEWKWPRFYVAVAATGMWIFFLGSQWLAVGSLRSILLYIPLLIFNIVVVLRIGRIRGTGVG